MTEVELPVFGEYTLNVPAWFAVKTNYYGNPSRKVWWKLANPMSNARNLASRKKDLSVNVERSGIQEPEVNQDYPNTADIEVERFSNEDQTRLRKWARASKSDIFTNYPALSRGRPETLPKNKEINKNFPGYDDDFINMVRKTREGKIIKKTGFSGFKPDKSSSYYKEKAPSVSDIGDALQNLFGDVDEVQSENKKSSTKSWLDDFFELIDEFGDNIDFRDELVDEVRSLVEVQSEGSEKLSKKSEKILKQGTPKQVVNEVDALLFADDTPSVSSKSSKKSSIKTPSVFPTPSEDDDWFLQQGKSPSVSSKASSRSKTSIMTPSDDGISSLSSQYPTPKYSPSPPPKPPTPKAKPPTPKKAPPRGQIAGRMGDFIEVWSEQWNKYYWWNEKTDESRWTKPKPPTPKTTPPPPKYKPATPKTTPPAKKAPPASKPASFSESNFGFNELPGETFPEMAKMKSGYENYLAGWRKWNK